jgi:hypothetical protein
VRLLANLQMLGLNQRTPGQAFTYFVDTDLTPNTFLYDANSRTGARLFNLGAGLPLVAELNYVDGARGDRDDREGVIQDPGTFGELVQEHQFSASTSSPILTIDANTPIRWRRRCLPPAQWCDQGSTSNQVGYLVLPERRNRGIPA